MHKPIMQLRPTSATLTIPDLKMEELSLVKIDLENFFYHFRLKDTLMAFKFKGKMYHFARLPMGLRMVPAVAHHYMVAVIPELRAECPEVVKSRVHVDDVLLFIKTKGAKKTCLLYTSPSPRD